MEIVCYENMTSVYELERFEINIHWIIKHFLYHNDEVLYFVESGFLKAVVSIGDIFRYLEGRRPKLLNTDFTQVSDNDLGKTLDFFLEHPTIHELPMVNSLGHFVGIIKSGNSNSEYLWTKFRNYMSALYYGLSSYYQEQSKRFTECFKGKIFLIDLPNDEEVFRHLQSEDKKKAFEKKQIIPPLEQLRCMTEQEERDYWGDGYEPGVSKKFAKEFSELNVLEKNGCKYFENHKEEKYITFDGGKRAVINKNEWAKRKIYLVGPCTIFGAYVMDNQTVEYYLQQYINNAGYAFQVVNWGALGLYQEFQYLLTECLSDEDMVIIASQNKALATSVKKCRNTFYLGDYSDVFDTIDNPIACVLDTFRHVNYKVSREIARRMYKSIERFLPSQNKQVIKGGASYPELFYFLGYY